MKPARATWKEKILQLDLIGVALIIASVLCYLLALQWGGVQKAWGSPDVIGTLVGFGLLIVVFGLNEWWQGDRALTLGKVLSDRTIASGCAFSFL